jgi:hypothetical protein
MLMHPPSLDVLRHEMRRHVCARCRWRPRHTGGVGPEVVRPCEESCPVFLHLPRLRRVAVLTDPMLRDRADALRRAIGSVCESPPRDAGDAGSARIPDPDALPQNGPCPLRLYADDVTRVLLDRIGRW